MKLLLFMKESEWVIGEFKKYCGRIDSIPSAIQHDLRPFVGEKKFYGFKAIDSKDFKGWNYTYWGWASFLQ